MLHFVSLFVNFDAGSKKGNQVPGDPKWKAWLHTEHLANPRYAGRCERRWKLWCEFMLHSCLVFSPPVKQHVGLSKSQALVEEECLKRASFISQTKQVLWTPVTSLFSCCCWQTAFNVSGSLNNNYVVVNYWNNKFVTFSILTYLTVCWFSSI